ncbi:hypothetical protein ACSVBT_06870 [Afipia sp. TerB]
MADRLTEAQINLLRALDDGHMIAYSRDGDFGWLSGTNEILADEDIWALRDRQYISQEHDEREDDYGCDRITPAGRRALKSGGGE